MEIGPHWKKIWLTVRRESPYIRPNDINNILTVTATGLLDGVTYYKPYTVESYTNWRLAVVRETNRVLETFIKIICVNCNLDAAAAWNVFCNYLMFEYYGKVKDIDHIAKYELFTGNLLNAIWQFYSSERMFLIKTLQFILEKAKSNKEFGKFVEEKTVRKIRSSLYKQLTFLIQERVEGTSEKYRFFDEWSDRNYREQIEIMVTLLTTACYEEFEMNDLKEMFSLFVKQNIGDVGLKDFDITRRDIFANIKCLQNATVLIGITEWWEDEDIWSPHQRFMDNAISSIHQDTDYGVLDLAWATLLMTSTQSTVRAEWEGEEEYQKYFRLALKNKAFKILHNILINPVLQGAAVKQKLYKSCCRFMESVCFALNEENFIYEVEGAILSFSELLKDPSIIKAFFRDELLSLKSLYSCAIRKFPFDFEPLTHISRAILTHAEFSRKVITDLENLNGFTELYSTAKTDHQTYALSSTYRPFDSNLLIIPSGTPVTIWKSLDGSYITFKVNYSYFSILQQLLEVFIRDIEEGKPARPELFEKIIIGFELFFDMTKCDLKYVLKTCSIDTCIRYIRYIMNSSKRSLDDLKVVKLCFKICVVLIDQKSKEAVSLLLDTKYLPMPSRWNYSPMELLSSSMSQGGKVTRAICKDNLTPEVVELIEVYIEFVNSTIKNNCSAELQVTGIFFALFYIFPKFATMDFENEWKYQNTINECLVLLLHILEQDMKMDDNERYLFNKFFPLIMESDLILRSVVRIFAVSNVIVQGVIEKETNWEEDKSLIYLKCLKNSLVITKFLLNLNEKYNNEEQQRNFIKRLQEIHYQKKNIVKIISTFLNYSFDINIPKIVCRILKSLAQNRKVLMLAMLEADHSQISAMFLDRLRDPLYDEDTKVAIVELVSTCIEAQNGMTAAFFNVLEMNVQNKRSQDVQKADVEYGEDIADFMMEYLHNVKNSLEYLNNPLQNAILHLFYTLWSNKKSYLIETIVQKDEFWSLLLDPLFHRFSFKTETYAKLFAIMTIELCTWKLVDRKKVEERAKAIEQLKKNFEACPQKIREEEKRQEEEILNERKARENLVKVIREFLSSENDAVKKWIEYMNPKLQIKPMHSDDMDSLCLLRAWKNFIVMVRRELPETLNHSRTLDLLRKDSLKGLCYHFSNSGDKRILNDYAELLLLMVSNYSFSSSKDIKEDFDKLLSIFSSFIKYYSEMTRSLKECVFTILCHITRQYSPFLVENTMQTSIFVDLICKAFAFEYEILVLDITHSKVDLQDARKEADHDIQTLWVLLISVINRLLKLETIAEHMSIFTNYQILLCLLNSLELLINNKSLLKIAKITIQCLVNYAKSPIVKNFLVVNLDSFYESIRPPPEYINITVKPTAADVPWYLKEFWMIYTFLLDLFHILQTQLGFLILPSSLSFIHLYDDVLKILIGLVRMTTDVTALRLVCSCLKFFNAVYQYKRQWWTENEQSFSSILSTINETLNTSVGVILRPNISVFRIEGNEYVRFNKIETIPEEELVKLVTMHIEIISWCIRCLLECSPFLTEILGTYKTHRIFFLLIEHDYRVPQLIVEDPKTLTYGTLLCTMHFLCKTLTQIAQHSNQYITPSKKKIARFKGFPNFKSDSEKLIEAKSLSSEVKDFYFNKDHSGTYLSPEALHATQRFATSGVSGMSVPWLASLKSDLIVYTLESLTTLLAEQIFISLQNPNTMDRQQLQFIRRELCSELQFFHDFIRKRVTYLYNYSVQGNTVFRSFALKPLEEIVQIMPKVTSEHSKFWGAKQIEPNKSNVAYRKLLPKENKNLDDVPFLVEEDYLLLISHWFLNICGLGHQ